MVYYWHNFVAMTLWARIAKKTNQIIHSCGSALWSKRAFLSVGFLVLIVGAFSFPSTAFAEGINATSMVDSILNGLIQFVAYLFLELGKLALQLAIFFLKFFIELAGYNGYIDAPVVLTGWNMIRDLANMVFVVLLMVIAFATILGLEQYEWKKSLAKLIVAAILVNFSNLIFQLIIDVSQVFTITFLNAISATAGGNLISMFNMDRLYQIIYTDTSQGGNIQWELLVGAFMIFMFAACAAIIIGSYLAVMVFRVVVLWISIILSPLAFLLSSIPQTKSYAQEIWKEFTNHVIAAPIMVFFLWLAFASLSGGTVCNHIETHNALQASNFCQATDVQGQNVQPTISGATTWENMANFIIALAFLWVGLQKVQQLGVHSAGVLAKAASFVATVGTIASGYAAGRWLVGKGADAAKGIASDVGTIAKYRVKKALPGGGTLERFKQARTNLAVTAQSINDIKDNKQKARESLASVNLKERYANDLGASIVRAENAAALDKSETQQMVDAAKEREFDSEKEQFEKNKEAFLREKLGPEKYQELAQIEKQLQDDTLGTQKKAELLKQRKELTGMSAQEEREMEMAAAQGLRMHQARFSEEKAEELGQEIGGKVDEHFNFIRMNHAKRERDDAAKQMEKNLTEGLKGEIAVKLANMNDVDLKANLKEPLKATIKVDEQELHDVVLKPSAQERLKQEAIKESGDTQGDKFDNAFKRLEKIEKEDQLKEEKYNKLETEALTKAIGEIKSTQPDVYNKAKEEKAKQQVLAEKTEQEIEGMKMQGILDTFPKMRAMAAARNASNKKGKEESIINEMDAVINDQIRASEGKKPEKVRAMMRAKAREELEDYSDFSYQEKVDEFKDMYNSIKRLEEDPAKNASLIKQYNQRLSRVVASAINSGDAESIASTLAEIEPTLQGKNWNDKENIGKAIMMAIAPGTNWSSVQDEKEASALQEKIRKGLGDKANMIMRALAMAAGNAVQNHKQGFMTSLLREGFDKNGQKKMGFAFAMDKGIGEGKQLGTGNKNDGKKLVDEIIKAIHIPSQKLRDINDPRALFTSQYKDGKEIFSGVQKGLEILIERIPSMTANEFKSMSLPILNVLSGGSKASSSVNAEGSRFVFGEGKEEFRELMKTVMNGFKNNISNAPTEQVAGVIAENMRVMLKLMGVRKGMDGKSIDELTIGQKNAKKQIDKLMESLDIM